MSGVSPVIVAVDGGGSKTDVIALSPGGHVISRATGPGSSPHFIGVDASVAVIDELVGAVAGDSPVAQANVYLSGLDLPVEVETFRTAIDGLAWTSSSTVVENDLWALLRAGTAAQDAVAVVCGTGINAVGRRADGEVARFLALGVISGDWGGGSGIGEQALWHAARDVDRRGPRTSLTAALPGVFGLATIEDLIQALHLGALPLGDLARLAPTVTAHSDAGDPVAGELVDRQALEIALMAASCIQRLDLATREVPVVLGGGVLKQRNERLMSGISSALAQSAPRARIVHVAAPPISGAALLALESAGAPAAMIADAEDLLSGAGVGS